ncbi:endoribonuclease [Phycisphaerae bacterium]|jgi:2-aminomuconate deaminase|nr:endoribonuclease [Phycisphaerae bacterium]
MDHANQNINSANAAQALGAYSHARRVGDLLFLAGVGPRVRGSKQIPGAKVDAAGNLVDYDIEAEMRSCFENVRTILEEAGSNWENIVDVTVFLTNMKRDWQTYNRVYSEYFPPGSSQPTRTTCEISALPQGGDTSIHFEVKIIATVANPSPTAS